MIMRINLQALAGGLILLWLIPCLLETRELNPRGSIYEQRKFHWTILPVDSHEPGIPGTDKPQLIPGTGTKSCVEMCPECVSLAVMHPFGQIMEGYETCAVVLLLVIRSSQTQRTTRVQDSFCWGGRDENVLHNQRKMGIPVLDTERDSVGPWRETRLE